MNYQKLKEELVKLEPSIRRLLLTDLLFSGDLDYTEISQAYVEVLEQQRKEHYATISKLGMRLNATWDFVPKEARFTKAAAAFALLKSGVFATAPVEKTYKAYLDKNPFYEDEQGIPKTKLKDTPALGRPKKEVQQLPTKEDD